MIFPKLNDKKCAYVNLNLEAQIWIQNRENSKRGNPLIDPNICEQFVAEVHKKYKFDFSYGGYMEDRSVLWKGSYLEKWHTFTHLGIDINASAGTEIAASFDFSITKIDNDYPEEGGWGPRIIIRHASEPLYFIYAHLDRDIQKKVGERIANGQIFAKVGKPPFNGNWFPHLHVQGITAEYFSEIETKNLWSELDGYGLMGEMELNKTRFPDPTPYIELPS